MTCGRRLSGVLPLLILVSNMLRAASQNPQAFESEILDYEQADRRTPPPPHPVLFVGSSSLRLWTNLSSAFPGQPVVNRGFGGSTMQDLLHSFDRLVVPYRPRVVVVYEGDNDLARGDSPASVASDFVEFLDRMERQLPGTPVLLLAVKPSGSRAALMAAQQDLNSRLAAFAVHRRNVLFVDTFSPLLNDRGEPDPALYNADRLHLNRRGYEAWTPAIAGALRVVSSGKATP
jgi:lysophospholipase L1-like esterase